MSMIIYNIIYSFRGTDDFDVFDPQLVCMPRAWYPSDAHWVLVF